LKEKVFGYRLLEKERRVW